MQFLTTSEAQNRMGSSLTAAGIPVFPLPGQVVKRVSFENLPGYAYFSQAKDLIDGLQPYDWCLYWVVLTEVWSSNENLHLYYRLRESYGDRDLVDARPVLYAQRHETADLVSFLHLGMLFGWEAYLVTSHDYGRAFLSHDGYYDQCNGPAT